MTPLDIYFDAKHLEIVITRNGEEINRMSIGVAYYLKGNLPLEGGVLKIWEKEEPKAEEKQV